MAIKAADVKRLRDLTGAGMMDCKKALAEANGDFEAATEYLRKKGQKLAAKRADREATEGVVIALTNEDNTKGVIVNISCETDFVSRNDAFVSFAQSIGDLAMNETPASKDDLLNLQLGDSKVSELITEQVGKIGEKIELAAYEVLEGTSIVPYNHAGNSIGVLIALNKDRNDEITQVGKDIAMQVAAMKPIALDKDGVSEEQVQKEIEIGMEIARNEGKPEELLEKIAMGKLNRFYKDNTLLNQQFVKDSKQSVKQALQSVDSDLTVTAFKRVDLGK